MDIRWLEDFLSLAQTRSFVRSAQDRHISQPAFGRRVKSLEAWVGVPLVDRSSYPCALTREGQLFRDAAQEAVRILGDARGQLRGAARPRNRGISVATGKTLSLTFFPEWFARVGASGLDVRLSTTTMHDGTLQLVEGGVDFLLCYCHPEIPVLLDPEQFEFIRVGTERLMPVSAPGRSGRARHALPGSKAAPLPLLFLSPTTTQGRIVDSFLERNAGKVHVDKRIEIDFSETAALLVRQGTGLAWLPARVVQAAQATQPGALVSAGGEEYAIDFEIRLYRNAANRNPHVESIWQAAG